METNSKYQLLVTTCLNMDVIQASAKNLVTNHLATCINIVSNIHFTNGTIKLSSLLSVISYQLSVSNFSLPSITVNAPQQ
jgi:hypothetical protein